MIEWTAGYTNLAHLSNEWARSVKITDIEIRACRAERPAFDATRLRDSYSRDFEFLVITLKTDAGLSATSFGFAGDRGGAMAAEIAAFALKPFFLGRDPLYREKAWHDFRRHDRGFHLTPIYSFGQFDIACWLLGAESAGQPLYKYLGAYRDRVPVYGSSLRHTTVEAYVAEAMEIKTRGWPAYKVHPPGEFDFDLEVQREIRKAVGADFVLMSDPGPVYDFEQAMRMGRELERLGYVWFEEPLFDENFHGLRELTRSLDIPICGTEVLNKHPYSVAECISTRVVDIVRADVSWSGGITAVMKTAHLAEAFGVRCEIHTTVYHPLEIVNLHCCAAIQNCTYLELLVPERFFAFGLKTPLEIVSGVAVLPDTPGLGVAFDWDFIDNTTFRKL
jgi:L-alanine-DL-glutamate epimerase-like enolase superfamily enzyme